MARQQTQTGGREATTGVIPGAYALSVGNPVQPIPEGWKWTLLTDVARLESGHTPSRRHPEYWGGSIPWIGIRDATSNYGRTIYDTEQHTNQLGIDNSSARVLPEGTVCLSRTASVGYVVVMGRPMATSQDFVNWVCGDAINGRFLKYVLIAERDSLNMFSMGTTHQTIYYPEVKAFHVALPPRPEQDAISEFLGVLDDKIELNRRMNETLEAMARAIFKDWFIDYGPTRAKAEGRTPYLAPELWDLFPDALDDEDKPVGWVEIPLKQMGTVITGKTPSTKKPEFFGDKMPFLKIPDMHGRIFVLRTSTELSEEGARSQEKKTLPAGSVSVSCIATPGLVIFNHLDTQTNQQINSIVPTDCRQSHFVFWSCRQLASAVMLGGSGGSVFHNMNKTSFENLRLVHPGDEIARTYSKTVSQMHDRILSNEYESNTLAQTRDLLLPKLMSGEIRLCDAEKAVGAVA